MNGATAQIETIVAVTAAIGALVVATATLAWFMSDQFKKNRAEFWTGITSLHNTVTTKMDNHEKEDNRRFERLNDHLLELERRNMRKDEGDRSPKNPR